MPLHQHVETGEELIEDADHLGRREALREHGVVHDVGEEDRGLGEVVGDHLGGGLQSLGDRARQDVQEEGFRLLLLGPECRQRRVALVGERSEDREGDGGRTDDVQRQHRARERNRDICVREEHLAGDAGEHEDHDEGTEPDDSLTDFEEDESAERSHDAPHPNPSRRKEPAGQHLPGCRRQQDREELRDHELLEASGSRVDHQRAERDGEVDERDHAYRRAEPEIETAPHDGDGQDQDGEQDEQRLLLAQFLVVGGIGADPSEQRRPVGDPADPRSGCVLRRGRGRIFTRSA